MSRIRANSSPDLLPSSTMTEQYDDSALEGVAANIKLLLKLIEDHKDACSKDKKDGRRMLRVAGMMTILDMVRTRIQKCQSFGNKGSEAELRRCNTDLKPSNAPRDKRPNDNPIVDERERLKKDLNASLAARKSLQIMCSSLGKEKEIMAGELARKVHELSAMEEHISDLRAQNESLLEKVQEYAAAAEQGNCGAEDKESEGNATLQARNKVLSEQLLRSLDGYRSMKRRLREANEDKLVMQETIDEMGVKMEDSLERIKVLKQRMMDNEELANIEGEILGLEHLFEGFNLKVSKNGDRTGKVVQSKRGD